MTNVLQEAEEFKLPPSIGEQVVIDDMSHAHHGQHGTIERCGFGDGAIYLVRVPGEPNTIPLYLSQFQVSAGAPATALPATSHSVPPGAEQAPDPIGAADPGLVIAETGIAAGAGQGVGQGPSAGAYRLAPDEFEGFSPDERDDLWSAVTKLAKLHAKNYDFRGPAVTVDSLMDSAIGRAILSLRQWSAREFPPVIVRWLSTVYLKTFANELPEVQP